MSAPMVDARTAIPTITTLGLDPVQSATRQPAVGPRPVRRMDRYDIARRAALVGAIAGVIAGSGFAINQPVTGGLLVAANLITIISTARKGVRR